MTIPTNPQCGACGGRTKWAPAGYRCKSKSCGALTTRAPQTCDRCAHEKTSHRLGVFVGESEGRCIVKGCHCEAYRIPRPFVRALGVNANG